MKVLIVAACFVLVAVQVTNAFVIDAEGSEYLEQDQKDIVQGVTDLLTAFVKNRGVISALEPYLIEMRSRVDAKLAVRPSYLQTLASVLSRIHFPSSTIKAITLAVKAAAVAAATEAAAAAAAAEASS